MGIQKVPLDQSNRWVPNPAYYIRFKGAWDMQDFYESLVDWFRKRKFKFHEKVYKHKHPSPFGVERQYIWVADREEEDYITAHFEIYFHTYDAHDIEVVMKDGKKKVFTKGRIWLEIRHWGILDWEGRWKSNLFYAHLKSFYNKFVLRNRWMQMWSPRLRHMSNQLHEFVRMKLKMENANFEFIQAAGHHKITS